MKFDWWFFCRGTAIISRFDSLPKGLFLWAPLETLSALRVSIIVTHLGRGLSLLSSILIFRRQLGEVALKCLAASTTIELIHWNRCLHASIGEGSTISVLLSENVISHTSRGLLILLILSMSINAFLRNFSIPAANRKTAFSAWRCMDFHRSMTIIGPRVWCLLLVCRLLLSELIIIVSTETIWSAGTFHTVVCSAVIHILLWRILHLLSKTCSHLHRIKFILLGNISEGIALILLLVLCLILVDLILILHLLISLTCTKLPIYASHTLWSSRFICFRCFITPSKRELWVPA